jgi:hypothetical protein
MYRPVFDLSDIFRTSLNPTPATPAEQLAADARKLASEGKDLSSVTSAIDAEKRNRQRAIEKSLDATLELQKLSDAGKSRVSREFILVYQASGGQTKTVRGVEWPDDREDKTKNDYVTRVLLDAPGSAPFTRIQYSLGRFKEYLKDSNILYRIAYID